GFADLFHLVPIKESTEDETMTMMLGLIRELEAKHLCQFGLEALPSVLDLSRRYIRESAFPGKAAVLLHQLAVKYRGAVVTRNQVFEEFHAKSGLSVSFLENSNLRRDDVILQLKETVKGQNAAVEACADALLMAKARLNDPNRPLASFLFLGPTGVGKTQCVKSLASYLFSNEERLIRFDMNE